jgi:hypothetical protein
MIRSLFILFLVFYSGPGYSQPLAGTDALKQDVPMVTIPRKYLGMDNSSLDFEFKWSDNMQNDDDPLDWYVRFYTT